MNRRDFMLMTASVSLAFPVAARAGVLAYQPGLVDRELAAGGTVLVDFYASWCTTCAAQQKVMDGLRAGNPDYERNITFVQVDWDRFQDEALARRLRIPRRSTLVALKGEAELGRIVAGTSKAEIKALFDTALAAAAGA
jgi:thioredoxin 1